MFLLPGEGVVFPGEAVDVDCVVVFVGFSIGFDVGILVDTRVDGLTGSFVRGVVVGITPDVGMGPEKNE